VLLNSIIRELPYQNWLFQVLHGRKP